MVTSNYSHHYYKIAPPNIEHCCL